MHRYLLLAAAFMTVWGVAGPAARAHGPAAQPGHYDGHAAALGEPGDSKAATRTMEIQGAEMKFVPASLTVQIGRAHV